MTHVATLIFGDGFGPEVAPDHTDYSGCRRGRAGIEWEEGAVTGTIGPSRRGPPAIDPAVTSLLRTRAGLIGPLTTPLGTGIEAIIEELT